MNKKPTLFNLNITKNESDDEKQVVEIDIDGVIGIDYFKESDEQNTKERIREQLREISDIEADEIIVNISSLGGNVDHGLAIYDLLAEHSATVTTKVNGMTASAGTIIAQAGDKRIMSDNALYLIHQVWTFASGNRNKLQKIMKDLEKTDDRVANIYSKKGNKDKAYYMELMMEENGDGIWLDADEALERGLIDEVYEPLEKVASVDTQVFENLGLPIPQNISKESGESKRMTYTVGLEVEGLQELKDSLNEARQIIEDSNSTLEMNQDDPDLEEEEEKDLSRETEIEKSNSRERELELLKFTQ